MKPFLIKSKLTMVLSVCLLTLFSYSSFAEVERIGPISMAEVRNSSDRRSTFYIIDTERQMIIGGKDLASEKGVRSRRCIVRDPKMMAVLRAVSSRDTLAFDITERNRCINITRVRYSGSVAKEL